MRLNPLSSQILYHYSVSMIVSRFTAFTENFTEHFRSGHDSTSASSARSPRNIRSFWKWVSILCLPEPDTTFTRGSEADSPEELAGASLWAGTLSSTRFSQVILTILADHATGLPVSSHCLYFYLSVGFLLVHATGLPVLCYSYFHFLLMRDALLPAILMLEMYV